MKNKIELDTWYWHPMRRYCKTYRFFGPFAEVGRLGFWCKDDAGIKTWKYCWVLKSKLHPIEDNKEGEDEQRD